MGNAVQLTHGSRPSIGTRYRPAVFAAGTVSMLLLTTVGSLALWIALPWMVLGWSPTLVTTGSMTPVVAPGDVVMIRPAKSDELVSNTVILFSHPDTGPILHRIVAVLPDGTLQTRGDANASPDSELVASRDVRGVAVLDVPWVGRPSLWLRQGRVAAVVATGAVALVLIALAPRAFDSTFDPWASVERVNPAEVLLGRSRGNRANRRTASGAELLPEELHDVVLERLAAQTSVAQTRTLQLLEGLS